MSSREERIGVNEAVFREVNERIEDVAGSVGLESQVLDLVCECGNGGCVQRISMSSQEYEVLRSVSNHFAVVPGHEYLDVERIIERRTGYDVVAKIAQVPEQIAEETDPRN
jgi:hypothetical protein